MKQKYFYIVDTKYGNFFQGHSEYHPWILNSFTNDFLHAVRYTDMMVAMNDCERFTKERYDFDGNTHLEEGRLAVVRLDFTKVF